MTGCARFFCFFSTGRHEEMHGFFWREKETARKFEKSRVESYTNEKTLKGVARVDWVNFLI